MLQHRLDFGPDHAGSRELLVFASKSVGFTWFLCWNLILAQGFFSILAPMLGGDRFFNDFVVRFWVWGSWFSRTALLGLQKALFYKVSILKCYYGSRNRRIGSLNRAPVLGGDRFFNAISSVSISDRFSDRSRLRSKKVSKKVSKRNRNWKNEVC